MTRVKICGITQIEDALHAVACGAEMLGFNFYPKSPRYIAPERAREITASLPRAIECVGVFVNEPPFEIRRIAAVAGLDSVQLHGDESPEDCAALEDLHPIKAIQINDATALSRIVPYGDIRILLDSASPNFGGSGHRFDWSLARAVRQSVKYLILAGGLGADNVEAAIAAVVPDAVDACSRLEISPGVKDRECVARFIAVAHKIRSATVAEGK